MILSNNQKIKYRMDKIMKNKKIIIGTIVGIVIITLWIIIFANIITNINQQDITKNGISIKNNKEAIYDLFKNFPESKNIYYTTKNLYSERSIGPTIYQIDILAELTDEGYNTLIEQIEFQDMQKFEMKINPNKKTYNWKKVENIQIIESKDVEDASITNMYIDESQKTIYIIALGGN